MSYTNTDLVRKHLRDYSALTGTIEDAKLEFSSQVVQLDNVGLRDGTEKVKACTGWIPTKEIVTFATDTVSLGSENIIPNSCVVAADSSLSAIYNENADFVLLAGSGELTRVDGGAIESGQSAVVWYVPYRAYVRDVDYAISYRNGLVTRIEEGDIIAGQTALIDYEIVSGDLSDEIITNAIVEASALLASRIDSALEADGAAILTIAETYLTLAILCRVRAMDVLSSNLVAKSSASAVSNHFLEISDRYRTDADDLLKPFLNRPAQLSGPSKS